LTQSIDSSLIETQFTMMIQILFGEKRDSQWGHQIRVLLCRESRFLLLCCVSWRLKKDVLRNFGKIYWIRKKNSHIRTRRVHFDWNIFFKNK